jgi:hypothetical protein
MSKSFLIFCALAFVAMVTVAVRPALLVAEKRITGNTADQIAASARAISESMRPADLDLFQKGMMGFLLDQMEAQLAAGIPASVKDADHHMVQAMSGRTRAEIMERGRQFELEPKSPIVRIAEERRAWLESRGK